MSQELTPARKANIVNQKAILNSHFDRRRRRAQSRQKVTAGQKDEIIRRRYEGEDPRDLAVEFGISANYIRNLAQWNARSSYGA